MLTKSHLLSTAVAVGCLSVCVAPASAASVLFEDFEDGLGFFTTQDDGALVNPGLAGSSGAVAVDGTGKGNFRNIGRLDFTSIVNQIDASDPTITLLAKFEDTINSFGSGNPFAKIDVQLDNGLGTRGIPGQEVAAGVNSPNLGVERTITFDLSAFNSGAGNTALDFLLAPGATKAEIRFIQSNQSSGPLVEGITTIDNIAFNLTAIPEPMSVSAGLGLIGLAMRRRR